MHTNASQIQRPEMAFWMHHADAGIEPRQGTVCTVDIEIDKRRATILVVVRREEHSDLRIEMGSVKWSEFEAAGASLRDFKDNAVVEFMLDEDPTDPDVFVTLNYKSWRFEQPVHCDQLRSFVRLAYEGTTVLHESEDGN